MKKRFKEWFCCFLTAAAMAVSGAAPAYAYTNEAAQPAVEETKPPVIEETPAEDEAPPFSVSGNGQLVDDIPDDGTKQFLTIQTKNGNTFFMVLDRSRDSENVYMLSLVDEADLAGFLEEEEQEPDTEAAPVIEVPEPETSAETEADEEAGYTEQEPEKNGVNAGALFAGVLFLLCGTGGYYYFKVLKPRKEEDDMESENMELSDDIPYDSGGQDGSGEDDSQDEDGI